MTIDIDKIRSSGNSCPSGSAYKGAGYCQEIKCRAGGRHDPRLAGKAWDCGRGLLSSVLVADGLRTLFVSGWTGSASVGTLDPSCISSLSK